MYKQKMAEAAKDVSEVFTRLFDHRPFLRGEINFFQKEFEEKKGDQEVEDLFKALERATDIRATLIEKVQTAADDNLPRTIADIQVALHMCHDTLDVEQKFSTELLAKKREDRGRRLEAANQEVKEKLDLLEENFKEKEKDLRMYFQNLEKNMGCED
ncbi:biogenesis of lysosome-related organelles complex 1 subunit 5 isoform X2 [Oratosquilla oratoria]|uniref:biogenesis of lysosome-related organelles complex 1 subunit 5 isoform X2 n=1 Tax=Oratosquilla oratoria TaxID=337810 RepID=UPI003F75F172